MGLDLLAFNFAYVRVNLADLVDLALNFAHVRVNLADWR